MNEKHEALIIQNFATLRDCEHNCKVPDSSSKKALLWSAHIITTNYSRNVGVPLARGKIVERDELLLSLLSTCFTVRSSLSRSPEKMSVYGVEMKAEGKKRTEKHFSAPHSFSRSPVCLPIMRSIPIRSIICRRLYILFFIHEKFELFLLVRLSFPCHACRSAWICRVRCDDRAERKVFMPDISLFCTSLCAEGHIRKSS